MSNNKYQNICFMYCYLKYTYAKGIYICFSDFFVLHMSLKPFP